MILIFGEEHIINMDNIVSVEAKLINENTVELLFTTTAVRHYNDMLSGSYTNGLGIEFQVSKNEWLELLLAIENSEKVFTLWK